MGGDPPRHGPGHPGQDRPENHWAQPAPQAGTPERQRCAMSSERKDTLKKRLDENYTAFIESLQRKTVSEFITAGQYIIH